MENDAEKPKRTAIAPSVITLGSDKGFRMRVAGAGQAGAIDALRPSAIPSYAAPLPKRSPPPPEE